ncbi:MAG: oligopeptide transport system permease protein [Glaciecola sp.]|jgi:oligopeptide transport system permease protein
MSEAPTPVSDLEPDKAIAPPKEAGLWSDAWNDLKRNPYFVIGSSIVAIVMVMAIAPKLFTFWYPNEQNHEACSLLNSSNVKTQGRPSSGAWFGNDVQGCDYYLKTILGARTAIIMALLVSMGAAFVAVVGGMLSGFYGGVLDTLIARATDMVLAIPFILGALVYLSAREERDVLDVAIAVVLFSWPTMLRLMRSSVLTVKEQDFIAASRALGASDWRILIQHVLPNSIQPVIVVATLFAGSAIVAEAGLSFLGVGLQLPAVSWGLMIAKGSKRILDAPHLLFFPGIMLSATVLGFLMLGDAVRDALDPRNR